MSPETFRSFAFTVMILAAFPFLLGALCPPVARSVPALFAEDHLPGYYLENGASGRRLATLDAYVIPTPRGPRLWLRISAIGAGVDPVPGADGLPGANHVTAHELARVVGGGRLEVRSIADAFDRPGRFVTGSPGPVPERRIDEDGRIGVGEYPVELPTRLYVLAPLPADGEGTTELTVDGARRLVVAWKAEHGRVSLLRLESHAP